MIPAPQPETGRWPALTLTALMHLLLVAVLFFGVQWKRNAPTVVEAELWTARPQPAIEAPPPEPAPPEPKIEPKPEPKPEPKVEPPPPPKPDIAIKQEKKPPKPEPKKPEPKNPEPKKPEPKKPEPKPEIKPSLNDALAALQREETGKRIDAEKAQLAAAAASRAVASWGDKIRGKIRGNIVSPPNLQGNPTAEFTVTLLVTGEIMEVRLKRGSGIAAWDAAVERAILKSSPLPKPDNAAAFQRELQLKICPDEERGCR